MLVNDELGTFKTEEKHKIENWKTSLEIFKGELQITTHHKQCLGNKFV